MNVWEQCMIVIYTQDYTVLKKDADVAKEDLIRIYGKKLGAEAYTAVKNGRIGASYRKYGGLKCSHSQGHF